MMKKQNHDVAGILPPLLNSRLLTRARANTLTFALTLSVCLLSMTPAHAQKSLADSFGGLSKDNNQPINIEADSLEVLDDKKFALFSGNVNVKQGKFHLVSKKLKVTYSGSVGGAKKKDEPKGIKQIDATGKVAISTPDGQSATSDWAIFKVAQKIVTIGGNVVLSQGGNVMRGDKLVIDLNTGRSKLHSTSTSTNGKKGKRPRISGVFMPGKNKGGNPFGGATKKKIAPKAKQGAAKKTDLPWQNPGLSGAN